MATCTQAFAGLRLKASAKASPAKLSAKTTLGAKPVARAVVMSRTTRAHRLTVRAADDEAAPASAEAAPASASADEGDAPAPRGACRSDPPLRARHHRHSARFRDKASSRRVAPTASAICLATRARGGGRGARRRRISTRCSCSRPVATRAWRRSRPSPTRMLACGASRARRPLATPRGLGLWCSYPNARALRFSFRALRAARQTRGRRARHGLLSLLCVRSSDG